VIVQTTGGQLRGAAKDGVLRFRGIPYAAAPVGDRRLRPPVEHEGWEGVRDALEYGAMAPQVAGGLEAMLGASKQATSEDCLFLNVTTPGADDAGRPVMVWIHGGGFVTGAGSIPWYTGVRFAQRDDVVVVSINYRLGALGFLRLDGLDGSGNLGILDQVAALRWVRDNIAAFGGDPGNVTIFGESAGGMSVGTLLGTPDAAGLFHRAIPQSGACQSVSSPEQSEAAVAAVAAAAGVTESDLAELPLDRLLAAQQEVNATRAALLGGRGQMLPFQPTIDGVVLERQPLEAVRDGSAAGVSVLAGTTAEEMTLFTALAGGDPIDDATLLKRLGRLVGDDRAAEVLAVYQDEHPGASNDELYTAIGTDYVFRVPADDLLEAQHAHGETFAYRFAYRTPAFGGVLGACHALDVPFTFDVADHPSSSMFVGEATDGVRALGAGMRSAWASFARDGEPIGEGLPVWPAWDPGRRATMQLDERSTVVDDPLPKTRALWQ
jgi:para-nitrobenzyl esterase